MRAHIEGKQPLEIVPPPEFHGPDSSTWSPDERGCLVSVSLAMPVATTVDIRTREPVPAP